MGCRTGAAMDNWRPRCALISNISLRIAQPAALFPSRSTTDLRLRKPNILTNFSPLGYRRIIGTSIDIRYSIWKKRSFAPSAGEGGVESSHTLKLRGLLCSFHPQRWRGTRTQALPSRREPLCLTPWCNTPIVCAGLTSARSVSHLRRSSTDMGSGISCSSNQLKIISLCLPLFVRQTCRRSIAWIQYAIPLWRLGILATWPQPLATFLQFHLHGSRFRHFVLVGIISMEGRQCPANKPI